MVDIWNILGAVLGANNPKLGAAIKKAPSIGKTAFNIQTGNRFNSSTNKDFDGGSGRHSSASSRGIPYLNKRFPDILRESSQAPTPRNPLDDLLRMMQSMIGQQNPTYEPDYDNLMAQISGQVNPVYDARRAAIEQLMGRAQQRTSTGRQDIEGMYNALAKDYGTQGDLAAETMDQAQAESQALQGTLQKTISGTYSRIAQEQADLYKQLGIEAAAPETLGVQAEDQAFQESQAAQMGNLAEQYYNQIGAADQAYYQQGAPLAKLEGTNRSSDLLAQLQDYLAQSQAGITELEGQRSSDIMTAFNQLSSQAQQFAQQQSQQPDQWGRLMDLYRIMEPRYGQQGEPGMQSNIEQIARGTGLDPASASQFYKAVQDLGANPSVLYGEQTNPETGKSVKTTLPAIIRAIGEMNVSPQVKQALTIWAEQNFGR